LQAGDRVNVSGLTFTSQQQIAKQLASPAEIHFASNVFFTTAPRQLYNVWLNSCTNVHLYGGDLKQPNGSGFWMKDCQGCLWHDFYVHDCGGTGWLQTSVDRTSSNLSIFGESTNNAQDFTLDNHQEAGSGLHAGYVGGFFQNVYWSENVRVGLYAHQQPGGAGLECGPYFRNSEVYVKGQDLTFVAQIQTGGNAIQFYGACQNIIAQTECDNVARAVDLQLWAEATSINVNHGRVSNYRKPDPYEDYPGTSQISYTDCTTS